MHFATEGLPQSGDRWECEKDDRSVLWSAAEDRNKQRERLKPFASSEDVREFLAAHHNDSGSGLREPYREEHLNTLGESKMAGLPTHGFPRYQCVHVCGGPPHPLQSEVQDFFAESADNQTIT